MDQIQYAKSCGLLVKVDGTLVSNINHPWKVRGALLTESPVNNTALAEGALGLSGHAYDEAKFPRMNLKQLLREKGRVSLDESLFKEGGSIHDAVDTSAATSMMGPNAELPDTVVNSKGEEVEGFYTFGGKPTAMGPAIDLRIKIQEEKKRGD